MNMKPKSRYKPARIALIFWTVFIGVGALFGSMMMLIDPSGKIIGMDGLLPYFQVLPFADILFQNYIFAGVMLLMINGITNFSSAILLFLKKKSGIVLGAIFGVTLMLWICFQFVIFPPNFMSSIFFVFGFLQALTGYMALVFYQQETFVVCFSDYPNINKNHTVLVVYFSRMGYTKKIALEEANRLGADLYEIKAKEKTDGTLGFWWCGRFAMHRYPMPIEPVSIDLSTYTEVIICSPIWVFSLSSPVREFCRMAKGKIIDASYILVHYTKGMYRNAVKEMDDLLGIKHSSFSSVTCREGKYKERKTDSPHL